MFRTLNELLCASATRALALQRPDGSFPPGHNGPWNNVDTPVRVTAHWLILLNHAFGLTGHTEFRAAVGRARDYLAGPRSRPALAAFHCCVSDDPVWEANGLIGQAWALEALVEFGDFEVALDVARRHRFDANLGTWHMLGVRGEAGDVHRTLNQQVWFSVMVFRLARQTGDAALQTNARQFFEFLPRFLQMDGRCIDMLISARYLAGGWGRYLWQQAKKTRHPISEYRDACLAREQTHGYLGFTLYGLALLHQWAPELALWTDAVWRRALASSVAFADEQLFSLPSIRNRYAFSYNPVGIEMALAKQSFGELAGGSRSAREWLGRQLRDHFDAEECLMSRNTTDTNILAARLYEACRLQDMALGQLE